MIITRIQEAAARYPDTIAVQMKAGDQYHQYTYRDLISNIAALARALSEKGIKKGDCIAILSENRPEWMIAYLASVALGAIIVPLDAQLTEKEIAILIANSEARAVFVSAACKQKLPRNSALIIVSFDSLGDGGFTAMLAAPRDGMLLPTPSGDDLAAILYTSGTTGDPKGVMLSHANLASNAISAVKLDLVSHGDNLLCLLPLHHTYPAMVCMLLPFFTGASVTILNSLKGPDILNCIREASVSVLVGVPQLLSGFRRAIADEIQKKSAMTRVVVHLLLSMNALLRRALRVNRGETFFKAVHEKLGPRFRLFASGGARLERDVFTDMSNLGFTIIEGYGLTETAPLCTFNPLKKQKAGSIGIPVPDVEVKIMDPDENGQGELVVRGPNVMVGYYKKPRETAEVLKGGWFFTGDLGYRDKEGYFFITGRSKEMIVLSTGKKIFPEELEKFYKQIEAIKEICLIQSEHGLEAAVVPDFEYLRKMNLPNSREIIAFQIEKLAKDLPQYKHITGLKIFKDPLPVTRLGKLRRSVVTDLYRKEGEQAGTSVQEIDSDLLNDPVAKKLLACLVPFSRKKRIMPDDNLELDLGLDSLARVELVVNIEKSFGISLPDSFSSEVFTVKDALVKLQELIASGPIRSGRHVRMSWADILAQPLSEELMDPHMIEPGPLGNTIRWIIKSLLTIFFKVYGRLSVRGVQNLPEHGPYIIAPNHLSLADAPLVIAGISWNIVSQTCFLGTTEFFSGPVSSRIARLLHVIPVDMDTRLSSAMQLSAYMLRQGNILCIFPEGGRSRDGTVKEFKKGVGILAKELNIPVIPVAITGTYEMLAPGRKIPRPVHVALTFGKPLYPGDMDYDGIAKKLYEEVVALLGEKRE